jgi:phosphatidylglycerophosphate synthase
MFDGVLRKIVDPLLVGVARALANSGVSANLLTLTGAVVGIGAGLAVASQYYSLTLTLIILNRLLDGLDGMVARIKGPTPWGGYLDSIADYIFYVAIPVGFGLAIASNLLPALILSATFVLTAVSFLAFAAIVAQSGVAQSGVQNISGQQKAFFYARGIIEGGETIGFFLMMCVFPGWFAGLAYILAGLCIVSVVHRMWVAHKAFA